MFSDSILCQRSERNPQAVFLLLCDIFLRCCILTVFSCPPSNEWWAHGQLTPAWRRISFRSLLNWQSLCLRIGMETNGHMQAVVNGASQTSFCPRWSAIMSVTISIYLHCPSADNDCFGASRFQHFLLPFVAGELSFCSMRLLSSSVNAVWKSCGWSQLTSGRPCRSVMITVYLDWLWMLSAEEVISRDRLTWHSW